MSKKSVVISLPVRPAPGGAAEAPEADGWVRATAADTAAPRAGTLGMIDLTAARNPFELAMLVWTFPALATLHWMARVMGQPRP